MATVLHCVCYSPVYKPSANHTIPDTLTVEPFLKIIKLRRNEVINNTNNFLLLSIHRQIQNIKLWRMLNGIMLLIFIYPCNFKQANQSISLLFVYFCFRRKAGKFLQELYIIQNPTFSPSLFSDIHELISGMIRIKCREQNKQVFLF